MDIIEKARELGRLIQEEDSYKNCRTLRRMQMQIWSFSVLSVNSILKECQSTMKHQKRERSGKAF